MEAKFWTALAASLLAALVTALGIITIRAYESWARKYSVYFVCFAAGILVSVSFLHIIPKSFEMTAAAPVWLLTGFVLLHMFNRFLTAFVCEQEPDSQPGDSRSGDSQSGIGLIAAVGIGLHSFIDGVVYAVTFSVSIFTGVLAAVGMVLHEFPEGIVTYVLLVRGGYKEKTAAAVAFLAASLSTPLGMVVSYPFVSRSDKPLLGVLLSLSAGALIYVGATHLLPQAEKERRKYTIAAFAAGILAAVLIVASK